MRMSNSSLALLLLLALFASFSTSFSHSIVNDLKVSFLSDESDESYKLDDGSSNYKLRLRLLLQSDTPSPPSPTDDYADAPTSPGNNADGPTSDTSLGNNADSPTSNTSSDTSTSPSNNADSPTSDTSSDTHTHSGTRTSPGNPTSPGTPTSSGKGTPNPTAPSPPASGGNKLTIILGTSVPTSIIFTTILGILGRRFYKKRKSTRAGTTRHSNGSYVTPEAHGKDVVVELAVNFGGAANK